MIFFELFFIFVIALLITLLFGIGFGRTGPWGSLIAFFVVLFLAVWAIAGWLVPTGPLLFGLAWIPILIIAVVIGLLLASMYPHNYRAPQVETISEVKAEEKQLERTTRALDFFFWFLVFLLIGIIILGFVLTPPTTAEPIEPVEPEVEVSAYRSQFAAIAARSSMSTTPSPPAGARSASSQPAGQSAAIQ